MSHPSRQESHPLRENVFEHLRREDGEHVGYIELTDDGRFIPYDRLWLRRGEAMDLDEAEAVLDEIGLRLLAEDWLLQEEDEAPGRAGWVRVRIREIHRDRVVVARTVDDLSAKVAKAVNLIDGIELRLPTTRLRPLRTGR
ncbi:serine/threonine protein phosphatase [Actinomyces weissii]|uniref:Serine/threonine protein phosphatase n=1 Tax=Actinomyces weissii TaxID=675090 RepID=A0A7T7M9N3_9ACTO|nr:serine/threonine protein phosphatase [Actinomyces weissii]QQM67496.1 serine/threonine protein phosphatase [Actinomyces weissii]